MLAFWSTAQTSYGGVARWAGDWPTSPATHAEGTDSGEQPAIAIHYLISFCASLEAARDAL